MKIFYLPLFLVTFFLLSASAEQQRPNILLFLADDVGYGDSPAYNPESKIPMPHTERLAESGLRFEQAYSSGAVCAPTRYSILTGNYPWRGRAYGGGWFFNDRPQILEEQMTVAEALNQAGYHTAMFGKMHLGGSFPAKEGDGYIYFSKNQGSDVFQKIDFTEKFDDGPTDEGFDYSYVLPSGIQAQPYAFFRNDRLVGDPDDLTVLPAGGKDKAWSRQEGFGMPDWKTEQAGPKLLDDAIAFIERHATEKQDQPFFIHYSAQAAHKPWIPPESLRGVPVKGVTKMTAHTDMVYETDVALGHLIEALRTNDLLENTIIIYTSDNGGVDWERKFGHDACGHLRGHKGQIYEGGSRIPMIVNWGGLVGASKIDEGTVRPELVTTHDLFATLADLADVPVPDGQALDSISFTPALMPGREAPGYPRTWLLGQTVPKADRSFIREGDWKLILTRKSAKPLELYNLEDDEAETDNLVDAPEHRATVEHLRAKYQQALESAQTKSIPAI